MPRQSTIDAATGKRLRAALRAEHGNLSAAAKAIGVSRHAAARWLEANPESSHQEAIDLLRLLQVEIKDIDRRLVMMIRLMEQS